jgi:hypothetical protein
MVIPENPPWLNPKPTFNFELTQHKKSETNPLLIQQHFAEIRSVTSEYSAIYTDGSKDGDRVASAAVYFRNPIWIKSTIYINLIKPCYPHPSRYWTQILKY